MNQAERLILLLLLLQVVTTGFLLTLDSLSSVSEALFALFLAVDLFSFGIVSYIYRVNKNDSSISRLWVIVGTSIIAVLLLSSLFVT
jgi:hypothetical protein